MALKSYRRKRKLRTGAVAAVAIVLCIVALGIFAYMEFFHHTAGTPAGSGASASSASHASVASRASASVSSAGDGLLILVNKTYAVPDDYNPEFASIPISYFISSSKQEQDHFVAAAAPYITGMIDAARKDGVNLCIVSGYRSKEYQEGLFSKDVNSYVKTGLTSSEASSKTAKTVAVPGYSEHQTGLAMDLGYNGNSYLNGSDYEKTPAFSWLSGHAADYGFILRYPKDKVAVTGYSYEPWHYRFVGVDNAKKIKASGLCLEEYLQKAGTK